jgi:hypothetical protein
MTDSENATVGTTGQVVAGLDIDHEHAVVTVHHIEDVHALHAEQLVSPRTPRTGGAIPTAQWLADTAPPLCSDLTQR